MPMTLNAYFIALKNDVALLVPQLEGPLSQQVGVIETVVAEGLEIKGRLSDFPHKDRIEAALQSIGSSFINSVNKKTEYLPDVNSQDELLFSIVYLRHLKRYKDVSENSLLFNYGLNNEKPAVEMAANELKRKIIQYCQNVSNAASLVRLGEVYPEEAALLKEWIAPKCIEEKLIVQIEAEAKTIINGYQSVNRNPVDLFGLLDFKLKEKEDLLRQIASYKRFIERLQSGVLSLEMLKDPTAALPYSKSDLSLWNDLNNGIPDVGKTSSVARYVSRSAIGFGTRFAQLGSTVVKGTVGLFMPSFISRRTLMLATKLEDLIESYTPASSMQLRTDKIIMAAKEKIAASANALNSATTDKISGEDFNDESADRITEMANKVATIRRMVNLQKTIEHYRAVHTQGLVKFSLTGIFGKISEWMSVSILRPLIFDKVLLILEARNLERKLAQLIEETNNAAAFDKTTIISELSTALGTTQRATTSIYRESNYLLFRKESKFASEQLKRVVDTATKTVIGEEDTQTNETQPVGTEDRTSRMGG